MPKFMSKPVEVEAEQFQPDVKPWPLGVEAIPCWCAELAQDGERCPQHPVKYYRIGGPDRKILDVNPGDWIIRGEWDHRASRVLSDAIFRKRYEAA
jgi:hypothetical protein